MKIVGVNHVGLAPRDPEQARKFFSLLLGLGESGRETVEDQNVSVSFHPCGETRLEVLEAAGQGGAVASFLERKGGGIHHVAIEVEDLDAWIVYLQQGGVKMVDTTPRKGAHGTRIAFIHPSATGGILVELVEENKGSC